MAYKAEIPYGCYWSTPFARWQGAFANLNAVEFAAQVVRRELARRDLPAKAFDHGVLGLSVPQKYSFYGLPWLAGLAGVGHIGGPTLMQACATGVRVLLAGAQEIECGMSNASLAVTCDRTSNGPHLYYPNPRGPGGTGTHEDWVMDNFGCDPLGGHAMVETAENVAKKHGIGTAEGLAKLKPVMEGGTVTYGAQTFPADGNAAIVIATPEKARDLSKDKAVRIRLLGFGQARAALAYMPEAPVPAAQRALAQAGVSVKDLKAIKTHNPFALNDIVFARATGAQLERMNNYGCSLVWGHPQAPMGTRAVIELIEELVLRGGGYGLFTGCAAGDTAMAVVLEVSGG